MKYHSKQEKTAAIAIIAIVSTPGVLGVVVVTVAAVTIQLQEAEAAGWPMTIPAPNASNGRCFR